MKFGYAKIPTHDVKTFVMEFLKNEDNGLTSRTFEDFHRWYVSTSDNRLVLHKKQWPLLLSGFRNEFIEDGWHRFASYVIQRRRSIPILLFPKTENT